MNRHQPCHELAVLSLMLFSVGALFLGLLLRGIAAGAELPPFPDDMTVPDTNVVSVPREPFLPRSGPVLKLAWNYPTNQPGVKFRVYTGTKIDRSDWVPMIDTVYTVAAIQTDEFGLVGVKAVRISDGVESGWNE